MVIDGDYADDSESAVVQRLYAYELLCEHFGRKLDGDNSIHYLEDLGWETAALEFRTPIKLQAPRNFPVTGYLSTDQVREEYERLKDEQIDDDDSELSNAREEFLWWLKQCVDQRLALVTFCY